MGRGWGVKGAAVLVGSFLGLTCASAVLGDEKAIEASRSKWNAKYDEFWRQGFTTGTLDEYFGDATGQKFKLLRRSPGSAMFISPKYPDEVYVIYQSRSIQGRDLLLGPIRMPDQYRSDYVDFWKVQDPTLAFDESKHRAGLYRDNKNSAAMAVIFEVRSDGLMPIEALYYPKRVAAPNLVGESANRIERVKELAFSPQGIQILIPLAALALWGTLMLRRRGRLSKQAQGLGVYYDVQKLIDSGEVTGRVEGRSFFVMSSQEAAYTRVRIAGRQAFSTARQQGKVSTAAFPKWLVDFIHAVAPANNTAAQDLFGGDLIVERNRLEWTVDSFPPDPEKVNVVISMLGKLVAELERRSNGRDAAR